MKPTALCRWLVRLCCKRGGLILDPFTGTGSILAAARAEGMRAVGIEQSQVYCRLGRARLVGTEPSLFPEAP